MKDKIDIEKLFSDKLANHESIVSDKVWSGIQSQIGVGVSSTAAVAKGVSMTSKWIIGIASVVAVSAVAVVLNFTETKNEITSPEEITKDTTELIAENNDEIIDNKEAIVSQETTTSSVAINSNEASVQINNTASEVINSESNSNTTTVNSPEKLIVKQATTSPVKQTPIYIDENKSREENRQVVNRVEVLKLPVRPEVTGSVQEWKKTNVFSPNNDGVNDLFYLESKDLKEFSITIINEKNAVVFISDDPNFKWDGTDYKTGEMVPVGNYGYIVFAVDNYKNPIKIFNSLKISR